MSTYSSPGSPTYSVSFDSLPEMMNALSDNTTNDINAKDIRDTTLTLWDKINAVSASQSGTYSSDTIYYTNSNPTTAAVGGITLGTTFNNASITSIFDNLFYPYIAPITSITVSNVNREFGSSNAVAINWSVLKGKNNIVSITVFGESITPSGGNQSGTKNSTITQNTNTTISMSVNDGVNTINNSKNVVWQNKKYWGSINLSSIGNPNLTLAPTFSATVGTFITNSMVLGLTGAGVGTGSELSSNLSKSYLNINGSGGYLTFGHPSSFGTPSFNVNGLENTAFTKVKNQFTFTNQFGFTQSYDVWVSNTLQNSPLNIIVT